MSDRIFEQAAAGKKKRVAILTGTPGIGDFIVRIPAIRLIAGHFETTVILSLPESAREFVESFFPEGDVRFVFNQKYQKSYLDRFLVFPHELKRFWTIRGGFDAVFLMSDFNSFLGIVKLTILAHVLSPWSRKFSIAPDRLFFPGFRNIRLPRLIHKRRRYEAFARIALAALGIEGLPASEELRASRPRSADFPKRIVIVPGSKMPSRRWPYYPRLVADIKRKYGDNVEISVTGSTDEKSLLIDIARDGARVYAGSPLADVKNLIDSADLVICNDSGLMHVSVWVGTQTIVLCGGEVYEVWCDYKEPHFHPLRHAVECYPCRRWECDHKSCLAGIEVIDVMRTVGAVFGPVPAVPRGSPAA